jgi:predicted ATPase
VSDLLPDEASLADLGRFMLKDFDVPERIFQLVHPDIEPSFPAIRASPAFAHNLPDVRTSFVGRGAEIEAIGDLLASHRLVSVVGPGGAGKTRLVVECGSHLVSRFSDGVRMVDLSPLDDPELVPAAIAAALGIRDRHGTNIFESLAAELSGRETLVILDNCEHVLIAAGAAADELLSSLPRIRVLATSREPLGITGEQVWRISPLAVPSSNDTADELLNIDSVRLFVERARLADAQFMLTEENAESVAAICRRVEGLPLALELVAARASVISPEAMSERLARGVAFASGRTRGRAKRHRTIEATIDWSYQLLDEPGKQLLRVLGGFTGGFSLDAAEAVGGEGLNEDLLETLGTLVDKSLVVWDGETNRYRLLETIRNFARTRLDQAGEADVVSGRHLRWYADLVESLEPRMRGADQKAAFAIVDGEIDNLRAAVVWAQDHDPAAGLRLAGRLIYYWEDHAGSGEGRGWCERLLARAENVPSIDRGKALRLIAVSAWRFGEYSLAHDRARQAVEILRHLDENAALHALITEAAMASVLGRVEESRRLHLEALEMARRLGDMRAESTALTALAEIERADGNPVSSRQYAEAAVDVARACGIPTSIALSLINLGHALLANGADPRVAASKFTAALRIADDVRSPMFLGWALDGMAKALQDLEPERAARFAGAALSLREAYGLRLDPRDEDEADRVRIRLEEQLGDVRLKQFMSEAAHVRVDDAAAFALAGDPAD